MIAPAVQLPSLTEATRLDQVARAALLADDRRIVIVGAGGWIGRATLAGLFDVFGEDAARQRVVCFGSSACDIDFGVNKIAQRPLDEIADLAAMPTLLLHLAFLTKDKVAGMAEGDYVAANRAISRKVHDVLDAIGADRVFVASSGAAAHADDAAAAHDLRLYGSLKRADEDLFARWAVAGRDRRVMPMRIYSLAGPFINKHETYALASFILDALAGRRIAVRAPMRVERGYVALRELVSLIFAEMSDNGPAVLRLDSGGRALELGEVAAAVAERLGGQVERAAIVRDDANVYVPDPHAYDSLLNQHAIAPVPLCDQIADTACWLAAKGD